MNVYQISRIVNNLPGMLVLSLLFLLPLTSCDTDDIPQESYYTFTGDRLGEYLQENPEQFSEFVEFLERSNVLGLLNAYGYYTCFAPTNDAIKEYYDFKGISGIDDMSSENIEKLVKDHIIVGFTITTEDFVEGRLAQLSMNNRYISTSFSSYQEGIPVIMVNRTSPILESNIEVHNGVIHVIGEVLKPTEKTLVEAIESDDRFSLFYEALMVTNLDDKLELIEDKSYNRSDYYYANDGVIRLGVLMTLPDYRKYGYTALIESDSIYKLNGIETLDDMRAYAKTTYDAVYPEDAGIPDETDPGNSLNRFVAYHLLNKQLGYTKFIIDYNDENVYATNLLYDAYEYIATMCPNTLIEVRTMRSENKYNLFNYVSSTGEHIEIVETNYDNDAINGVYHEIDGILSYNFSVASEISSKRLRMDVAGFFPELANNNMRGRGSNSTLRYILPPGYIDGMDITEETEIQYYSADDNLGTYQSDELCSIVGMYDITMTTLPVPAGTYEVRISYQPNGNRGAAQLYFDGQPTGIPLDLNVMANDPSVGYIQPGLDPTDPEGYENDKMMRNRGYMKGPSSFRCGHWYEAPSARMSTAYLRRILGIYTFKEPGVHTFRAKAARSGQFQLDFIEFVPTEILEKEGID
jgi:uncharacterized surface protein with fasciclin (FAS1) repeats